MLEYMRDAIQEWLDELQSENKISVQSSFSIWDIYELAEDIEAEFDWRESLPEN